MIVGIIWRKPVLTYASIIFGGMLASVNSVNVGSQFYLPPMRASTSGMGHACLYSRAAERPTLWPILISHPAEGRRLSRPQTFTH